MCEYLPYKVICTKDSGVPYGAPLLIMRCEYNVKIGNLFCKHEIKAYFCN